MIVDVTKRAATYLRVSTSDQNSQLQADETRQLISRRGWSLADEFCDQGASGAKSKRPGLQAMLEAARRRSFDVLVVYRGDRLWRSVHDFSGTLLRLNELGVEYVSVCEPFDTTTSHGELLIHVLAAFAQFERSLLRERTRDGVAAARRRGKRVGRPRAYVDVNRARVLRARGFSLQAIAIELGVGLSTLKRNREISAQA